MMLTNYALNWSGSNYPMLVMSLVKKSAMDANPRVFYVIQVVECLFLISTLLTTWFFALSLKRHQLYHVNICRIVLFNYLSFYISFFGRLVTFLYEIEVFPTTGTWNDWPMLLFSFLRLQFITQFIFLIPSITVERWFASYFIADYEQHSRPWVCLLIIASSVIITLAIVFTVMRGLFGIEVVCVYVSLTVIFIFLFTSVYKFNILKLKNLNKYYTTNETYSLSIRFQLIENVRTMKHLMIMGLILLVVIFVAIYLSVCAIIWNDLSSSSGQICASLFEMWISIAEAIVIFSFEIVNSQYKKGNLAMIGTTPTKYLIEEQIRRSKEDATQMHFSALNQFW